MTKTQRLRMTIDITMTILSIILMGGNYLFPADIVHEILGVWLFALDYISIIILFATISHLIASRLKKNR